MDTSLVLGITGTVLGGLGTAVSVFTAIRVYVRDRPNIEVEVGSIFHVIEESQVVQFAIVEIHALNNSDAANVVNWLRLVIDERQGEGGQPASHWESKDGKLILATHERTLTMPKPDAHINWLDLPVNLGPRSGVHGSVVFSIPDIPMTRIAETTFRLEVEPGHGNNFLVAVPVVDPERPLLRFDSSDEQAAAVVPGQANVPETPPEDGGAVS